jgi:hypothetical protein
MSRCHTTRHANSESPIRSVVTKNLQPLPDYELAQPTVADHWQAALLAGINEGRIAPVYGELRHTFTPGPNGTQLYAREITMPAGSVIVSEIHNTCHPFVVSQGRCFVHTPDGKIEQISAPHQGVTTPGTQRVLAIATDTVWTTFHIVPEGMSDPEEIKRMITTPIRNPLLP